MSTSKEEPVQNTSKRNRVKLECNTEPAKFLPVKKASWVLELEQEYRQASDGGGDSPSSASKKHNDISLLQNSFFHWSMNQTTASGKRKKSRKASLGSTAPYTLPQQAPNGGGNGSDSQGTQQTGSRPLRAVRMKQQQHQLSTSPISPAAAGTSPVRALARRDSLQLSSPEDFAQQQSVANASKADELSRNNFLEGLQIASSLQHQQLLQQQQLQFQNHFGSTPQQTVNANNNSNNNNNNYNNSIQQDYSTLFLNALYEAVPPNPFEPSLSNVQTFRFIPQPSTQPHNISTSPQQYQQQQLQQQTHPTTTPTTLPQGTLAYNESAMVAQPGTITLQDVDRIISRTVLQSLATVEAIYNAEGVPPCTFLDMTGRLLWQNKGMEKLGRTTLDVLLGKSIIDVCAASVPELGSMLLAVIMDGSPTVEYDAPPARVSVGNVICERVATRVRGVRVDDIHTNEPLFYVMSTEPKMLMYTDVATPQ